MFSQEEATAIVVMTITVTFVLNQISFNQPVLKAITHPPMYASIGALIYQVITI